MDVDGGEPRVVHEAGGRRRGHVRHEPTAPDTDAGRGHLRMRPRHAMAPCDPHRYGLLGVEGYHDNCRDNLHAALAALGVTIPATPPSLNLFMNIPWTAEGRLAWGEPVSTPGSSVVFRAEMDLVIAFSACPQDILPINGRLGRTTDAHYTIEGPASRSGPKGS